MNNAQRLPSRWMVAVIAQSVIGAPLHAEEYMLESSIISEYVVRDSLFLTSSDSDLVSLLELRPTLDAAVRSDRWEAGLEGAFIIDKYSEDRYDNNRLRLALDGEHRLTPRDSLRLDISYTESNNLDPAADDFGVSAIRSSKEVTSISPGFRSRISERLNIDMNINHSETEYSAGSDAIFRDYEIDVFSVYVPYTLTELSSVWMSLSASDYETDDTDTQYYNYTASVGYSDALNERTQYSLQVGSNRSVTSFRTFTPQIIFGQTVLIVTENEVENTGAVYVASLESRTELARFNVSASRSNTTSTTGGLNRIDKLSFGYDRELTELSSMASNLTFSDTEAVTSFQTQSDRETIKFDISWKHKLAKGLSLMFKYKYTQREFTDGRANPEADQNAVHMKLEYSIANLSSY